MSKTDYDKNILTAGIVRKKIIAVKNCHKI